MPSRAALLAFLLCAAPAPGQPLLERILAVVEGRPLLLSEVRVLQSVRGLEEKAALEELIDERLMLREAGRLAQSAVSPAEEERGLALLRESNPAAREAAESDLRRLVRRQTAIVKYIEFRFRPQVSVSEEAVRRAFSERYPQPASAPPLPEVEGALREQLARRALDERIEAWVAELRAAADVRYN
ncbi:MAG TPA: hypothetical protein VFO85_17135 [Vicinamibacteria bacterium]|nr:hypothetical protein [Vicinamibacteria bacterium]